MSYAPEVIADTTGEWAGNSLRFATENEAMEYAKDLAFRWFAVKHIRAIESDDPVNSIWTGEKILPCADAC